MQPSSAEELVIHRRVLRQPSASKRAVVLKQMFQDEHWHGNWQKEPLEIFCDPARKAEREEFCFSQEPILLYVEFLHYFYYM
jgi:hypothetical protein